MRLGAAVGAVRPAIITMLGTPHSGKTTYLLAMYGMLSLGVGREAIVADPNQDYLIAEDWDRLCREGQLPPPTADEPQEHRFTFTRDLDQVVVDLEWTDFRGGAMDARVPDDDSSADTAQLISRMRRSDSIYLVLDGEQLAAAPSDSAAATTMLTRRMTSLVRSAIRGRQAAGQPPPSLVALITKADRLVAQRRNDEEIWETMNVTTRRVRSLLPVLSEAGVRALICPVSLGHLGEHRDGKVDPAQIRPLWPEKPVLFSVVAHLDAEHSTWEREQAAAAAEASGIVAEQARTRWVERRRRRELETAALAARTRQAAAEKAGQVCRGWADVLRPSLRDTPVYFGGEPGMGVEHV
jgi:Double-GTPase 2